MKQRQERFMAMEPVLFKILHYKRPQNQDSIDEFENELHQFTKECLVFKGEQKRKRHQSVAASDIGSVAQSFVEKY